MKESSKMSKYDFDEIIDRKETGSVKWDHFKGMYPEYNVTADVLPMWVADMDFRCPQAVVNVLKKRAEHGIFGYTSLEEGFFTAVQSWLGRRLGWHIDTGWIVPTPGVVPAVTYAVQSFTEEGDGVLIQTPVYYPFKNSCIKLNKRRAEEAKLIEKDGFYEIDFDDFEAKASKPDVKLFILCSPHNPVGRVWTHEELERMIKICQKHDVLIFSDEIHSDLIMHGYKHTATGLIDKKNLIAAYAPSKTFNLAGLKMSVIVIPDDSIRRRFKAQIARDEAGGTNCFAPAALETAYNECEDWLEELLDYIDGNLRYTAEYINNNIPGVKARKAEGTYFLWADFRGTGLSTKEINRMVLEEAKIAGDLGEWFGETGAGFVRFNLACPRSTAEEMLKRLEKAFC
jgi:cystathionine beta-lyase